MRGRDESPLERHSHHGERVLGNRAGAGAVSGPAGAVLGYQLVASLPLQMCFYFSLLFPPCWTAVLGVVFHTELDRMDVLSRYIYVTVLCGAMLMELVHLHVGYVGSMREEVPQMAGFWLTSLLLLNSGALRLAAELAVLGPQAALLVAQLAPGYVAVRRLTRHQVTKFHAAIEAREELKTE